MFYLFQTPGWLRKLYPKRVWELSRDSGALYLTFDDGPHPRITAYVLDELKKHNAKATFFCIGKNVMAYPDIFNRIISEGHAVGNHTYGHLNGWKSDDKTYIDNIRQAEQSIHSKLFRPPYGRMKRSQEKKLTALTDPFITVMWTLLSGDFDATLSPQKCWEKLHKHAKPGSVIVFHDSEKANDRLRYTLPLVLEYFGKQGLRFNRIEQ